MIVCTDSGCPCVEIRTARQRMITELRSAVTCKGMEMSGEVKRSQVLHERLKNGENIFDHIKLEGSASHTPVQKSEAELTERRVKAEQRWKAGIEGTPRGTKLFRTGNYPESPQRTLGLEIPEQAIAIPRTPCKIVQVSHTEYVCSVHHTIIPATAKIPTECQPKVTLSCSFCGAEVQRVRATEGIGDVIIKFDETVVCEDPYTTEREIKIRNTKVIACPDCADRIRPITKIVCRTCGMSEKKCPCSVYVPNEVITHMNCKTYSEG